MVYIYIHIYLLGWKICMDNFIKCFMYFHVHIPAIGLLEGRTCLSIIAVSQIYHRVFAGHVFFACFTPATHLCTHEHPIKMQKHNGIYIYLLALKPEKKKVLRIIPVSDSKTRVLHFSGFSPSDFWLNCGQVHQRMSFKQSCPENKTPSGCGYPVPAYNL